MESLSDEDSNEEDEGGGLTRGESPSLVTSWHQVIHYVDLRTDTR